MKYIYKNIGIVLSISFLLASQLKTDAQTTVNKLLVRDSLDFSKKQVGVNSKSNDYNPTPYKGGLLYVSNKKTNTNALGLNKVYWVANNEIGTTKNDTLLYKNAKLNDDFTAPTSNDNNILTRYSRKRDIATLNEVEKAFTNFNPSQSFTLDSANTIVYAKLGNKKRDGAYKWELWQANLEKGKLKQDKRIAILDSNADYLYPNLSKDGNKLYFASNRKGGKGGFDIYALNKINGVWATAPIAMEAINSTANEIYPVDGAADFTYTSNMTGGLGGYDVYTLNKATNKSNNIGYPINTASDDLAMNKLSDNYYLARKANGSIDMSIINHKPIYIPVKGQLAYLADSSIVASQKIYVKDNEEGHIIDSFFTDANASYKFTAKPNRNYTFIGQNADGYKEEFTLAITDKVTPIASLAFNFKGRSPKQIKDSITAVWVMAENKRLDSIAATSLDQKFIVRYGFDKSSLVPKEILVLDSLLNKLNAMPDAYIVVGAFTDCIGSYKYNYNLSVKRAKFVVNYLVKKGLNKNRIVSNGYSKNYTVTPCLTKYSKQKQFDNRRAEIVLSDTKNTNWANLQKARGDKYYSLYNSDNKIVPTSNKVITTKIDAPKVIAVKPVVIKKADVVIKKDTIAVAAIKAIPVKKVSVVKQVDTLIKKDTLAIAAVKSAIPAKKITTIAKPKFTSTPIKTTTAIIASPSKYNDEELSKAEIILALDSLAKLKIEQERIVEYLTKRINKKPIDVFVTGDSVSIEIYDNAIHDKDSVSIIYNNRLIVDRQELKVNKPIKFMLKVEKNKKYNELIMVAENLGINPPNTAVMFVTEKSGRRQQVLLATDMTHNEVIYFIRIGKE
jgi:outer membrane protein OmpA-like peptidoglycan-associated protein